MFGSAALDPNTTQSNLYPHCNPFLGETLDQDDVFSGWDDTETLLKKPAGTKRDARLELLADAAAYECEMQNDPHLLPGNAALQYFDNFPTVPPESIRVWTKLLDRKAWRGFNKGTRPYQRYFDQFLDPYLYTLDLADLNISKKLQRRIDRARAKRLDLDLDAPLQIYLNADLLKALVLDNLDHGAAWLKLEGNTTGVHLHLIAERMAIRPDLQRLDAKQSGKVAPVYDAQGLTAYLLKPIFTVKRFDPDSPNEAIQKLALSIAARRVYLNAGHSRLPNMFQFYRAKRPVLITQYSEAKKDATATPVSVPLPATARPLKPQKPRNITKASTARPADDSAGTRSDPVLPHLRL